MPRASSLYDFLAGLPTRRPLVLLGLILVAAAAFRLFGLDWGIPYHHFNADEFLALAGSDKLRQNPQGAAESLKFFIYPVLPKYLHGLLVDSYEWMRQPLDLTARADQGILILLGRVISAVLGTATAFVTFLAARRVAGTLAGLAAAALMAASVEHIRTSHFFTSDTSLTFFCTIALAAFVAIAESGSWRAYVLAGVSVGAAMSCKYTGAFLLLPLAFAHGLAPNRPAWRDRWSVWARWSGRGLLAGTLALAIFLATNPLIFAYPEKFLRDIQEGVIEPNFGDDGPIWTQQFADIPHLWRYWFTNLLPWGLGPAFAITGVTGIGWLLWRRGRGAWTVAAYAIAYYAIAAQTTTPFMRYILPLVPALAIAAGVVCVDLLARAPARRPRQLALAMVTIVLGTTWLWAIAYMQVYVREDTRVQAAAFIQRRIPEEAQVLVEPSQNTPPMGSYFTDPIFHYDYVGWGAQTTRDDYYHMHTLDVKSYLYADDVPVEDKRRYIAERLAKANYIVMDDTYLEFYEHLHGPEHQPVRQYYDDLFAGRLDFKLMRAFEVKPSLFGLDIHDEAAEMTFTLFDHPQVYVFMRNPDRSPRSN
jgi:hypothetical protein